MVRKVGRPKQFEDLKALNTKLQADHKTTIDAIIKVGAYGGLRELLEEWTEDYLKANPEEAEKVKVYKDMTVGKSN